MNYDRIELLRLYPIIDIIMGIVVLMYDYTLSSFIGFKDLSLSNRLS